MEWIRKMQKIFGADDVEKISRFCREYWPGEVDHAVRTAEDACGNTFVFDFPWDMERTREPVHFEKEIDWSLIPAGDREFLWQFNRHRFLVSLAQAYRMTGDEKYAENYVRLMSDWMQRADEGVRESLDDGPWRTLEAAIRAEMWLCSLPLVIGSPSVTEGFLGEVEACIKKHQKRLLESFSPRKYISNWGVIESCGLFLFSLVIPGSEEAAEEALRRLEQTARVQVLPDGAQWEQSPMYHNEVYHCYLTVLYYGRRAGIDMPDVLEDTAKKMAYVNYQWKCPDHTQFAQGDSDATDLRDQITAGAYLFSDGMLKSGGYGRLDYDSAWKFGWQGCMKYEKLEAVQPDFVSAQLPFSGNYYLRSGWEEKDSLLHFRCGDTGGGHGHADKLHVDLVIRGENILTDSGRYTYMESPERFQFKEAAAHNTVVVDGESFSECESTWDYKTLCTCLKQQYYEGKYADFVEGSHLGYWEKGVIVNRRVIAIHPELYIIADDFHSSGNHTYESYFHFDGNGSASLYHAENGTSGIHFQGRETEAWLQSPDPEEAWELLDTEQSCSYNEKHSKQTGKGTMTGRGFCRKITVINGGEKGKAHPAYIKRIALSGGESGKLRDMKEAEGLQIICGGREYVLFLCHREIQAPADILSWENCIGNGRVVLFDRTEEKKRQITGEILSW